MTKEFDPRDRHATSPCCDGRMLILEQVNTQVGRQVVYACITCGHLAVWIEPKEEEKSERCPTCGGYFGDYGTCVTVGCEEFL